MKKKKRMRLKGCERKTLLPRPIFIVMAGQGTRIAKTDGEDAA